MGVRGGNGVRLIWKQSSREPRSAAGRVLWIGVIVSLLLSACSSLPGLTRARPTPAISIDLPLQTQGHLRDFDSLVNALRDQYIAPNALGADWQANVTAARDRVTNGLDNSAFFDTLDQLLAVLKDDDLTLIRPAAQLTVADQVTTTFSGIGILAGPPAPGQDRLLVLGVYPGSPAEAAGIRPHDAIVRVAGQPVDYAGRAQIQSRLRGPSGTQVTITVRSPGKDERALTLTRQPISAGGGLVAKRLPRTNVAYIDPANGSVDSLRLDVAQALRDLSANAPPDALVLDLRTMQNSQFPVEDMLTLFAFGPVGTLYAHSQGKEQKAKVEITGKDIAGSQQLPLVVLVSDQTRGPAESFAGILLDMGRARIVGHATPGRVALVAPLQLLNTGAVVLIPSGEYRGVKDTSWYGKGITPDVPSDQRWEDFTDEDDPQITLALQALSR
jgi:carboxyl-terminal processing protease